MLVYTYNNYKYSTNHCSICARKWYTPFPYCFVVRYGASTGGFSSSRGLRSVLATSKICEFCIGSNAKNK